MKKLFLFLFLLSTLYASAQIDNYVPKRPSPARLVNDFTGTLTREQADELERKLVTYDDSTSNQIAVVIIPTTGDYPIEDVALQILRTWGVGNTKNNNGIVLLIAKNDRKIRMEMGYGLEGAIPDMTAAYIIDHSITPRFKEENYYAGLDEGTTEIFKAAAGEYKAPVGYRKKKTKGIGIGSIIIGIILISIVIGGSSGGRNGGMVSRRGYRDFGTGWIIGSLLGGAGGSGGGGGGGWSGGGGGFGGFGGGSGGGGGASGSW
jgi:uncharacterized protein